MKPVPARADRWVYDNTVNIGIFESTDYNVPVTAYVGFAACVHLDLWLAPADWDTFLRGTFPEATSQDSSITWQAAHDVLCPFAEVAG